MKLEIYFDGACDNKKINPPMGIGVATYIGGEYREEWSRGLNAGVGTSNIAEYKALLEGIKVALEYCTKYGWFEIIFRGDSQLIINQVNGLWQVKNEKLKPLFAEVCKELMGLKKLGCPFRLLWIRRIFNQKADELSKIGLEKMFIK